MKANKLQSSLKKRFDVIDETIHGDGGTLIIEQSGKTFALCITGDEFQIYACNRSNNEWQFGSSSKTGKTAKTANNFIQSRI